MSWRQETLNMSVFEWVLRFGSGSAADFELKQDPLLRIPSVHKEAVCVFQLISLKKKERKKKKPLE